MPARTDRRPRFHRNPVPPPDWSAYAWHLTRYDIDEVCHYTYFIPVLHGFTQTFLDEHHPGWTLNGIRAVFAAAGVLLDDRFGAPLGGRCHWQVKALHFDSVDSFAVEWDETVTEDDRRFYWAGDRAATGRGAFFGDADASADEILGSIGGVVTQAADAPPGVGAIGPL